MLALFDYLNIVNSDMKKKIPYVFCFALQFFEIKIYFVFALAVNTQCDTEINKLKLNEATLFFAFLNLFALVSYVCSIPVRMDV